MHIQIEYNDFNMHAIREIYGPKTEAYVQPGRGGGPNIIIAIVREAGGGVEYIYDDMARVAERISEYSRNVNSQTQRMPCVFS